MDSNRFLVFYQSINRIVKDIKRLEMKYMSEHGLRSVHMGCLLCIKHSEKGVTVTQLAKATKTDKALISRVVKELLSDGFITTKSADKTYNKKYILTEKSEIVTDDVEEIISKHMANARAGIPEEKLNVFYEVLSTLEHNISHDANKG